MKQEITVGSDFSGVGAFDQAIHRVSQNKGFKVRNVFACDMDKFARQSYLANYEAPGYYPENVYEREIPKQSLDIYMTSPPCQSFSLAGKRKGKGDKRGVLFFNSWEFIDKNRPRFFIFENVKGLLSDDEGRTFQEWCNMLGGKSVNGVPVIFPFEESVPYHIYFKVINSKHHGVPQNRERVFIIGIRDDEDNQFTWPKGEPLTTRLKDVLEQEVDEKYFLSEKGLLGMINHTVKHREKGNGFSFDPCFGFNEIASAITTRAGSRPDDNFILVSKEVRTEDSKKKRKSTGTNDFRGKELEFRWQDFMNTITTSLTKDHFIFDKFKIRKLTPLECFRLQDFPDEFKFVVSDTQLYKQAGNSISVKPLEKILDKLLLIRK